MPRDNQLATSSHRAHKLTATEILAGGRPRNVVMPQEGFERTRKKAILQAKLKGGSDPYTRPYAQIRPLRATGIRADRGAPFARHPIMTNKRNLMGSCRVWGPS